ncbi:MAG: hypothetical protein ABIH00_02010 [Armatimonadota bacterium]
MKFQDFYKALVRKKYYIFSFNDILTFFPKENKSNLEKRIYTWKKKGWVYSIKKGLYELTYPQDIIIPDLYIANRLYAPSYISLETALSYYSIIPEVAMGATSITTKPTRKFKNKHGFFSYRTVKPVLFTGYSILEQNGFEVLIAEPEKALVDYLYFNKGVDFEEERFEKDVLSKLNRRKLRYYAELCNINLKRFYAYLRDID